MSYISIKNLSKEYKGKKVLENINLTIKKGQFVSIVGPYGSGKTTILKVIAGLINDYSGSISVNNKPPAELRRERKVGYAFQKATLLPWRNVLDNVALPLEIVGKSDKASALKLLSLVGMEELASKSISELSGGMQQLVAILRSLVLEPDVLLLDEPFSSIDEFSKDKLHEQLLEIHSLSHKTTIMVTHSLQEAVYLSDVVIVLSKNPARVKYILEPKLKNRSIDAKYSKEVLSHIQTLRKELQIT